MGLHRKSLEKFKNQGAAERMSRRTSWLGLAVGLAISSTLAWAQDQVPQTTDQKIQQLQKEIDDLQKEVKGDESTDTGQTPGSTTADFPNGFTVRSKDGNFVLHIGADLQIDNRTYYGAGSTGDIDTIVIRRARPTLFGTVYKYVDFFIRPDFGQGATALYDAYIQLNYIPWFQIRAGKFKPPVGLERLQNDDDTDFAERGLPSLLGPQRDIGFQLGSATLFHNRLSYQLGVFDGVPDSSIGADTAVSGHRDYAGRLFLTPFAPNEKNLLRGLGLGIGAEGGNTDGEALPSYKTFGQQSFLTFASGVTAAGHRTRLDPQAYYYVGPFGLLAEYALNEEGFQKGSVRRNIAFRAYQAEASYFLTGEKSSYGTPVPKKNFDPLHHGGWGAIQLAVRVGDWEAENGVYTYGLVSSATSPRHLHEWDGGVNWFLNRLLKIDLDYANTAFGGGAAASAGGNKLPEKVFIMRFQINFGQF
jgi:phosphate-selective porin OprO/OprP